MAARVAVLTISTSRAAGGGGASSGGEDQSGARLLAFAQDLGLAIAGSEVIADDRALIEARLRHWCDLEGCALVLTTGGTGLAPADVTPEATRAVIERDVPGIPEAMREASRPYTPNWMLSRAVAGVRGSSLIVNFPGSPRSIEQAGAAIAHALGHALALIGGEDPGH